jgi:hypothetical protein
LIFETRRDEGNNKQPKKNTDSAMMYHANEPQVLKETNTEHFSSSILSRLVSSVVSCCIVLQWLSVEREIVIRGMIQSNSRKEDSRIQNRDCNKRRKTDPVKLEKIRQQKRDCEKRRKTDPVKLEKIRQQKRDCEKRRMADPVKLEKIRQQKRDSEKRRMADPVELEKKRQQDRNRKNDPVKLAAREEQYKIFNEKREKLLEQERETGESTLPQQIDEFWAYITGISSKTQNVRHSANQTLILTHVLIQTPRAF